MVLTANGAVGYNSVVGCGICLVTEDIIIFFKKGGKRENSSANRPMIEMAGS